MKSIVSLLFLIILIICCKPIENATPNGKSCLVTYQKVNEKNSIRLFIPGLDTVYKERLLIDSREYFYEYNIDNKISKINLNRRSGIDETDSLKKPLFVQYVYTFSYDNKSLLTKTDVSWENFNDLGERRGYVLEYSYENNRLITLKKIYKSLAPLVETRKFTYDEKNNLSLIESSRSDNINGTFTDQYENGHSKSNGDIYNNKGLLIKTAFPTQFSFEYDNNNNLTYLEAKIDGKFWYSFENKYDDKKQLVLFDADSHYRTKSGNDNFPYLINDNIETPFFMGEVPTVVGRANFLDGKNNQIYSKVKLDKYRDGNVKIIEIRNDFEYDSEGNPISYKRYFNNVFSGNEMSAQYFCK